MKKVSQEVADNLEEKLYDYKEDYKKGEMSGDMLNCIVWTVLDTLDNWTPKLDTVIRSEVLDWFQSEYGLCL